MVISYFPNAFNVIPYIIKFYRDLLQFILTDFLCKISIGDRVNKHYIEFLFKLIISLLIRLFVTELRNAFVH